ncbi:MAG TPA: glycosyltransferase [Flavisolibacter sp.]|jgi:glycosyltransferase involved in cell wall biosynthesis|nr:glycosyltransferase [Flavisolibacter sp.]
MNKQKKILFLLPYPIRRAPSQRFRVEAFFPYLKEKGFTFKTHTFFDDSVWKILYQQGSVLQKGWGVTKGFVSRWVILLFEAWRYDFIFIHREAAPIGPPVFEWILAKLFRKRLIYDFDDAIWIPNTSNENKLANWFKAFWKVRHICKWAYKVVGGNDYLCSYAGNFNRNIVKIPTCVDINRHTNALKVSHQEKLIVGWTGSHSTLSYLDAIVPVVEKLQQDFKFTFLVISNKAPELKLRDWVFIRWSEKTEIEDLLKIDIGIMPLKNDEWSEGKCGFKIIQYLALGIPAVASPVGVNSKIIQDGLSGFLCNTEEEWVQVLKNLLTDACLRKQMGNEGRKKIVEEYSVQSQKEKFVHLFA